MRYGNNVVEKYGQILTSELKHIGIKTYERKPNSKRSYEKEKKVIVLFGTFIILF